MLTPKCFNYMRLTLVKDSRINATVSLSDMRIWDFWVKGTKVGTGILRDTKITLRITDRNDFFHPDSQGHIKVKQLRDNIIDHQQHRCSDWSCVVAGGEDVSIL